MRAPLVINSTHMKKIICFIPNISRFCVSIDFTGTLNANCDFVDILRQWGCLDYVLNSFPIPTPKRNVMDLGVGNHFAE